MEYMQGYVSGVLQSLVTLVLIHAVIFIKGAWTARKTMQEFKDFMEREADEQKKD